MIDFADWSPSAGDNTQIDGTNIAEHCDPGNVNDALRSQMANVAAFRDLIGGAATTTGAANAYALASGLGLMSYAQGLLIGFEANHTNSGAATLNVDAVGAKAITLNDGAALAASDIVAGGLYLVGYEADADAFRLVNPSIGFALTAAGAVTLTNKTIDGDDNTLQDIATAALKSRSGSDADIVTGTAGSNGNLLAWNGDGDAVDSGIAGGSVLQSADIGATVQGYDADTLKADVSNTLAVGYAAAPYNAGTKSSGTFTPSLANGNLQYVTNNGAHTLAAPTTDGVVTILYTNGGSAGTLSFSGFTAGSANGDNLTTSGGNRFLIQIIRINGIANYHVKALQ